MWSMPLSGPEVVIEDAVAFGLAIDVLSTIVRQSQLLESPGLDTVLAILVLLY